ncbi:MAG: dihydrodipicolinate reductase C-terminal domain-containing protein [Phycisphaerae bacterium]
MRAGLIGFGRTGKAVASVLLQSKETCLCWVIRKSQTLQYRSVPEFLGVESDEPGLIYMRDEMPIGRLLGEMPVDVIVDFSSEEGIEYYGEEAARRGISIISAISSYPDHKIAFLRELARTTRVLWSPNITIGVNFLILASKILKLIAPAVDIEVVEEHFKTKKEVSGTAKIIARSLAVAEDSIKSIRAGGIIGRHEILFGFPYQTVRMIHESITREAFGNGALFAAKSIAKQPIGFYSMEDFLIPYLSFVMDGLEVNRVEGPENGAGPENYTLFVPRA